MQKSKVIKRIMVMSHSFTLSSNIYWTHLLSTFTLSVNIASTIKRQLWSGIQTNELDSFNSIMNNTVLLNTHILRTICLHSLARQITGRQQKEVAYDGRKNALNFWLQALNQSHFLDKHHPLKINRAMEYQYQYLLSDLTLFENK